MDADFISSLIGSLSPEDIESLKGVAGSLLSGNAEEAAPSSPVRDTAPDSRAAMSGTAAENDTDTLAKLTGLLGKMNGTADSRVQLLHSLKPFLSNERQKKADEAVRMMRLIELLPAMKDILGLF